MRCLLLPEHPEVGHHLQVDEELDDYCEVDIVVVVTLVQVSYWLFKAINPRSTLTIKNQGWNILAEIVARPVVEVEVPGLLFSKLPLQNEQRYEVAEVRYGLAHVEHAHVAEYHIFNHFDECSVV